MATSRLANLVLLAVVACTLTSGGARADEFAERKAEIERLSPLEQEHLLHKQERFAKFSQEEQQRMRKLYADLEHDPHGDELRRVMTRYHEWLDTLPASARAELVELPPDERLARIAELAQQQAAKRQTELQEAPTAEDLKSILAWMEAFAWQHREELLATLPPARGAYFSQLDETRLRRAMLWILVHRWHGGNHPQPPRPGEAEVAEVVRRLSPGAQARVQQAVGAQAKERLLGEWMQMAVRHRIETTGVRRLLPPIDGPELQRFSRQELSAAQREVLLQMPADQRHRLLLRMYFQPGDRVAQMRPDQWPGVPQARAGQGPRANRGKLPGAGKPKAKPQPQPEPPQTEP